MLGLLKQNCSNEYFSVRARRLVYLALVRFHIDYASEAWSGQSITITTAVERVKRRVTNFILSISRRTVPYKERLLQTNLLPLTYWHEDFPFIHGLPEWKIYIFVRIMFEQGNGD